MSPFSNQGSALEYFTCCPFHEAILFFRFPKKSLAYSGFMTPPAPVSLGRVCNSWVTSSTLPFNTFFFLYHSFSFSLQLLSVSYLSCHCLFSCHLSSFPWHCIFMLSAFSQTYSTQPLRELSLPVPSQQSACLIFSWVMLLFCVVIFWSTLPYCILTVLSEYKCGCFVVLFLFLVYFQVVHSLGTWLSNHIPIVQQS